MSIFTAPQWVNSLYSKFPLVVLEQEDTLDWKQAQTVGSVQSPYTLWVGRTSSCCTHFTGADPSGRNVPTRAQLGIFRSCLPARTASLPPPLGADSDPAMG